MKAFVSWSSGKDSAFALHIARNAGIEIAGVLTTITESYDRVAMHGVRHALLDRQIAALNIPAIKITIPTPCSNEIYDSRMADACAHIKTLGIRHVIFGDLFLEDIRAYREQRLAAIDMAPVFPLWQRDTATLARQMIASGLVAHITCLDPRRLSREFAGRRFDETLLSDLPPDIDPCGENGEFHTVVSAGPMFAAPIPIHIGETVERDGFIFTDVIPSPSSPRKACPAEAWGRDPAAGRPAPAFLHRHRMQPPRIPATGPPPPKSPPEPIIA